MNPVGCVALIILLLAWVGVLTSFSPGLLLFAIVYTVVLALVGTMVG